MRFPGIGVRFTVMALTPGSFRDTPIPGLRYGIKTCRRTIHRRFVEYCMDEEPMKTSMKALPLIALLAVALPPDAGAQSPEEKGLAIAEEMDRRDRGWGDQRADLAMILRNRRGQESRRAIRVSTLEVEGDGDKSLTVFDSPRDVHPGGRG